MSEPRPLDAGEAQRLYRSCPGSEVLEKAANVSWNPIETKIARHRALRNRLQLEFPEAGDRILLHSFGTHHTSVEFSVVAVRRSDGIWHVDEAGEESGGLLQIPAKETPHQTYDLSAEDSRRVDALIADRCLHAAPRFMRNPDIVAGGAVQTLETVTERQSAILSWFGIRTLQEEQLVKLIAR